MTTDERIYRHRKACLAHAERTGNVRKTCRVFQISHTTFYEWKSRAERYGLAGLWPRERRRPSQPNATPPWQVEIVLAEAISRPTLGARRLLEFLAERGVHLSASGVQKILRRHNLGRRGQRVAALAALTAATDGQVSQKLLDEDPYGFCHFAAFPGDLVALDAFYVGKLKGVGKVWQFTAIDTATRWAMVQLVIDQHTAAAAAAFLDLVIERFDELGVDVSRVLTDRGPEFVGRDFQDHLAELDIDHELTPPRSPNHNAVCERFQGIVLEEFYRPAFHRQFFTAVPVLQDQLDGWIERYNTSRRNHGDMMNGTTPAQAMAAKLDTLHEHQAA